MLPPQCTQFTIISHANEQKNAQYLVKIDYLPVPSLWWSWLRRLLVRPLFVCRAKVVSAGAADGRMRSTCQMKYVFFVVLGADNQEELDGMCVIKDVVRFEGH